MRSLILIIIPFFLSAHHARAQDSIEVRNQEFFELDTMTITEVMKLRDDSLIRTDDADFILSRTPAKKGFNYGVFWPDGTLVSLPTKAVEGTVSLNQEESGLSISWFQYDSRDGSYWRFTAPMPPIKDSLDLPRFIAVVPMMKKREE